MNTKKFIEQVISGDLGKNGVLEFASHVKRDYNGDIQALADDLLLLSQGALLYGRTQAVSDSEEIDRLEKAASVISEAYGLDWMEAGTPTLQELLNRKEWICQKLECLEALELGSDAIGKLVASKPELAELMDRIQAVSKGVSDTTGEPRDTKAAMRLYQEQLAEITAEIEQARQQEAARAAEPVTDPEQEAEEKRSANDQFSTNKSTEEIEKIFNNLKKAGFIDEQTLLAQWRAVCGFTKRGDTPKINWIGKQVELVNFVSELWVKNNQNNPDHWERTANCFLVNGSEQKAKNLSSSFQKPESKKNRVDLLKSIIRGTYTSSK